MPQKIDFAHLIDREGFEKVIKDIDLTHTIHIPKIIRATYYEKSFIPSDFVSTEKVFTETGKRYMDFDDKFHMQFKEY